MKIFLNELSIPKKISDVNELYEILNRLIVIAGLSRKICNNQQIQRHRDLKNTEVLPGKTLLEFVMELGQHKDPSKRKIKAVFLEIFAKAPFLTGYHSDEQSITDLKSQCLKGSCFDDASATRTGAAVISAEHSGTPSTPHIEVISSVYGKRKVLNIFSRDQLEKLIWKYESNAKHEIPKDFLVSGETHSAMHLTDEEAQKILSNGVMIGKSIFNKVGDQWYKFHCHENNIFHGFPINVKTPYKEYSLAKILYGNIEKNEDGQLFEELLEFRQMH